MTLARSADRYSDRGAFLSLVEAVGGPARPRQGAQMVTWQVAHQVANMAAAKAHASLGVDLSGTSVDVVRAVGSAQLQLMWQPMPRIFGAYVNEPGSDAGILVNSGLPRGARRYTAAHELGHHVLDHATTVDDGSTLDIVAAEEVASIPPATRRKAWPDQEKFAEAFAAWFLLPRRVVAHDLSILGLSRPRTPLDVYRLSLLLGASYRTTVRHLPNLKLAHPANGASWARVAPGRIKAEIDGDFTQPRTRVGDVWLVDRAFDNQVIAIQPGDRIALSDDLEGTVDVPPLLIPVPRERQRSALATAVYEVGSAASSSDPSPMVIGSASWTLTLQATDSPRGLDPRTLG